MPTYDYICPNGHRFEVIHSVIADGPASCPVCGAGPVRKAFSAPTIHFRGSGWAKKDRSSASRSASKAASASAESGSGSGSDAGGSSESASGTSKGTSRDGATGSDSKPASEKPSTTDTGSATGSSNPSGPAAD
jgi:putative FmdB family regulatory protein